MDLGYDTEQVILRSSAEKFLTERYDYAVFRQSSESDAGFDRELWNEFARLGWIGLPFAPDDGGSGGGAVELAILMEAFGRHLVVEPYLATAVLSGGLLARLGSPAERAAILPGVIEGRHLLAFAHDEAGNPTRAQRRGAGYVLQGTKRMVLGGPMADTLLVSAQPAAGRLGIFVVPRDTQGVTVRPVRLVDGRRAADVTLAEVAIPQSALLGGNEDAGMIVEAVIQQAIAASSADAVGAIAAMVKATVDYTKTRVQFGQPLAGFQALQHRMVRMRIAEEEARASSLLATLSLEGPPEARVRAVSGAKAKIGRCARHVHQEAIQLHGAVGTTGELSLGAYAKRLIAYEIVLGSTRAHLRRYALAIGDPAVAAQGPVMSGEPA